MNPFDRLQLDFSLPYLPYAREIARYAWLVYKQNLGVLALMTILVVFPAEYVTSYLLAPFANDPGTKLALVVGIGGVLFVVGLQTLLIPVMTHNLIEWMRTRENPALGDSFAFGIRLWARTLWIRLITAIGIVAGLVLFVIPGVLLWYRWAFTEVIVAVEERTEVGDILKRSTELSDDYRMNIFVAELLAGIPFAALGWAVDHVNKAFAHWAVQASMNGIVYIAGQYFFCLVLVCYLDRRGHEADTLKASAGA